MPTEEENIRVNVAMLANFLAVTEQVRERQSGGTVQGRLQRYMNGA
jgi:hypothetical protein